MGTSTYGLTDEEVKIVGRILNKIYQDIGYDLAECRGGGLMSRAEVYEVTCDAGRPQDEARTVEQKAAIKKFFEIPYDKRQRMAKLFFPYARYE